MEKPKIAKTKKEKLPSLQDCFIVKEVHGDLIDIRFEYNKASSEIIEYLEIPQHYISNNYHAILARFYHSSTGNCQVSTLILNIVSGTVHQSLINLSTPKTLKGVFKSVDKKKYLHIFNELLKYVSLQMKNNQVFRKKPLLLMDLNESVYNQMASIIDFSPAKINVPYKSSNNSNMRIILIPITTFNTLNL